MHAATAAGLEDIAERVRRLQARNLPPEALLAALRELERAVTREHAEAHRRRRGLSLLFSLVGLRRAAAELSRAEGLRQAAGRIAWFIQHAG